MSGVNAIVDQMRGQLQSVANIVRIRVLGANNERLDFLMDSFYKLSPPQRTAAFSGLIAVVGFFVFGAVILYFSQVSRLRSELNESFDALHEMQTLKTEYQNEQRRYDKLFEQISRKTGDLRPKPFFEKIANEQGVQIEGGLTETRVPLPPENPLSEKMQEVRVEMRLNNISIPRLLTFLVEVEKANNFVRVQDLEIKSRFGTRLYFDSKLKARAYSVSR